MVSRDTSVQAVAVAVAAALAVFTAQFGVLSGSTLALAALAYVVVFAGAHVYLAVRGDGETVPVTARWRFAALVVVAVGAMALAFRYGSVTVAGTPLSVVLGSTVVVLFVAYWLYEAREGYRVSRQS